MSKSTPTASSEAAKATSLSRVPVPSAQTAPEHDDGKATGVSQRLLNAVGGSNPQIPPARFNSLLGQVRGSSTLQAAALRQLQGSYGNNYVGRVIQRKCDCGGGSCAECEEKKVQRKGEGDMTRLPEGVDPAIERSSAGSPLDSSTRSMMESRFGEDFGEVRVHTDSGAAQAAEQIQAQAFTQARDIYFGAGRYQPQTEDGLRLVAHELTHVVQQRSGAARSQVSQYSVSNLTDASEREADAVANEVVAGRSLRSGPISAVGAGLVQRQFSGPFGPFGPRGFSLGPGKPPAPTGPTISQGPIGDVVINIGDWTFFDPISTTKDWKKSLDETTLFALPIPELGVTLDIRGSAGANATFTAGIGPGTLRNIRIGLSYEQAAALLPGFMGQRGVQGGPFTPKGLGLFAMLQLAISDFRGLADLDVRANIALNLGINGELKAAAAVLGLFDVATLSAGLNALANAGVNLTFGGQIGLYYENEHLTFRFSESLEAQLRLAFHLFAYIKASLLGFEWEKSWGLFSRELGTVWSVGAPLSVGYDNGAAVSMPLEEGAISVLSIVQQLFTVGSTIQNLVPISPVGTTPVGPTSSGGPPGPGPAPRGRSAEDPIDMTWFKPPEVYPQSLILSGRDYYFTKPKRISVPDDPDLADVRRDADTDGKISIGIARGGPFYPKIDSVWPRVAAGVLRGGVKQDQFRALLTAHGHAWGSQEADHVRDLQWAGEDAYYNLWPLERVHNNAANQILSQNVTYLDDTGNVVTVKLRTTPLNRYFRIIGFV